MTRIRRSGSIEEIRMTDDWKPGDGDPYTRIILIACDRTWLMRSDWTKMYRGGSND